MFDALEVSVVADAMREKRRELINQPLDRIWIHFAQAAMEAAEVFRVKTSER